MFSSRRSTRATCCSTHAAHLRGGNRAAEQGLPIVTGRGPVGEKPEPTEAVETVRRKDDIDGSRQWKQEKRRPSTASLFCP